MNQSGQYSLYTLNGIFYWLGRSRKVLFLTIFFFLTGISTGIFLELTMAAGEKADLSVYLQQFLDGRAAAAAYPGLFWRSLTSNLLLLAIIFLAGLSAFGIPAALAALGYKGMTLGFSTGLIAEALPDQGIRTILTTLLPQNLILIPVFVLAAAAAVNYGLSSLRGCRDGQKKSLTGSLGSYLLCISFLALLTALACALETILYAAVLSP